MHSNGPKRIKKTTKLIIRNLSFEANEDNIRKYFELHGNVTDINILRKPNGKLVGCAFVQYATVPEAAKAIKELNAQPFLGRPIAIDWALPKEKFQETGDKDKTELKEEEISLDPDLKIKTNGEERKTRKRKKKDGGDSEPDGEGVKHRKLNQNDADEGKTLFIWNLEFETSADELKTYFSTYGPLNYAEVCNHKLTEHPNSTAFVIFKNPADASKCLADFENDPSKFTLGRRQFVISLALSKTKLETKLQEGTKKEPKHERNLFLAREGYIRPGSDASIGVSVGDMNKRTAILEAKEHMFKKFNLFISDTRLCVHNLPASLTDTALGEIFLKHGGASAKVTEASVERILQDKDLNGVGRSKEFGFVTFTTHEHALKALRSVNNNPKIFTPSRRPIVDFSLGFLSYGIKGKANVAEKSREKNDAKQAKMGDNPIDEGKQGRKKKMAKEKIPHSAPQEEPSNKDGSDPEELPVYSGLTRKSHILTTLIEDQFRKGRTVSSFSA